MKQWVTNGTTANYCTAVVRTGGPGKDGISVLVIPLDSKGVTRSEIHNSGVELSGKIDTPNKSTGAEETRVNVVSYPVLVG